MTGAWKDSLHKGDLNQRPIGCDSPALTIRPRISSNLKLLSLNIKFVAFIDVVQSFINDGKNQEY